MRRGQAVVAVRFRQPAVERDVEMRGTERLRHSGIGSSSSNAFTKRTGGEPKDSVPSW